ncbi:MAG: RusA family crossover junction endodeoxyribonuclease [Planctomycetota bacterium]|jgi:Holliday junction resolvase RusA-like endonuclease
MNFTIHCIPPKSTHQANLRILKRHDGTQFVGKMKSSKGKAVERDLISLLTPHVPPEPFSGPIRLKVWWNYPWRKSEPKKNRTEGWKWCDTRPDCDNLLKLLEDVMTRLGFWTDDSQVAQVTFSKRWCDVPGIEIEVYELDEAIDRQSKAEGDE